MIRLLTSSIIMFIIIAFSSCSESQKNEFPKRVGNRLYTTDSTFHSMNGEDTLSKLLNDNTLEIAE